MTPQEVSKVIRTCFLAYKTEDRSMIEEVLADNFSFTSPYDDHIGRKTYFERCWPNAKRIREHHIDKLFVEGNEAFVLYTVELKSGERFRNTEFFVLESGKIKDVEVYFGTPSKEETA